jgi:3'-phosphoadenosine 5'-phosphosulfate sulfotransferase (PAPS reductase)/FAD synthetase
MNVVSRLINVPALAQRLPNQTAPDLQALAAIGERVAVAFASLGLAERVAAARAAVPGRLVFTTSFGLEDQAISHAIFAQDLAIDVVTFDTGRLFPETHQVWAETEQHYGRRIQALVPERRSVEAWVAQHGINGFRTSVEARQSCCGLRKVEPLGRALAGASAWVTGVRAEQSAERAMMSFTAIDPQHGRRYPLSIGGLSAGLVFGASETHLVGSVSNIRSPSDVAGVYGAAGAGAAVGAGTGAIVLTNEKGAVLSMSGRQVGLIANVDLSGLAITLR